MPLAGISIIQAIEDNAIDVRAIGRLNKLYVELLAENPSWARPERRADMNHFMARLIFLKQFAATILQRALYKDESGRRLTDTDMGPLFGDAAEPDDIESGTIYVLRSLSNHPFVVQHRELIHKIGVTGGSVQARVSAAIKDATYLLADVEIVATYKLHNLNRTRLENIFHRLFAAARLDIVIADRFGNPVRPEEWFLVPLHVIDDVVGRLRDGAVDGLRYDPVSAALLH